MLRSCNEEAGSKVASFPPPTQFWAGAGNEERAVLVATPTIALRLRPLTYTWDKRDSSTQTADTAHTANVTGAFFGRGLGTRLCKFVSPVINQG